VISRLERIILDGKFREDNVSYCRFVSFVEEAIGVFSFRRGALGVDNGDGRAEDQV